jgi:hypothetical protein
MLETAKIMIKTIVWQIHKPVMQLFIVTVKY